MDLDMLTNDRLIEQERRFRAEAEVLLRRANRCLVIRVARDATIQLREAAVAVKRAGERVQG